VLIVGRAQGQRLTEICDDIHHAFSSKRFTAGKVMPLLLIAIVLALPILDIYATLRLAEALAVPGWALFIPGVVAGIMLMKRETRTLKSRLVGAVQSMTLNSMVFDSGRRMIAGLLLLLPGMASDLFALFLLALPNRAAMAATSPTRSAGTSTASAPNASGAGAGGRATVDGEYRRVD
jgi:UPF0716 protein FxsA